MTEYTVELFKEGGEGAGQDAELGRDESLDVARALYRLMRLRYSDRLVMLCDRARILARSDRPETMPAGLQRDAVSNAHDDWMAGAARSAGVTSASLLSAHHLQNNQLPR